MRCDRCKDTGWDPQKMPDLGDGVTWQECRQCRSDPTKSWRDWEKGLPPKVNPKRGPDA